MLYGLINGDGTFARRHVGNTVEWRGSTLSNLSKMSHEERKAAGVYDFEYPPNNARPTDLETGTPVAGIDHSAGVVKERFAIEPIPVADAIAKKCAHVDTIAIEKRSTVVGNVSPYEAASWSIKRAEAVAYSASENPSDAPMLSLEAANRGVPVSNIVSRVSANAAAFGTYESAIAGVAGKHKDVLKTLTTVAEIQAYDITTGWPL